MKNLAKTSKNSKKSQRNSKFLSSQTPLAGQKHNNKNLKSQQKISDKSSGKSVKSSS